MPRKQITNLVARDPVGASGADGGEDCVGVRVPEGVTENQEGRRRAIVPDGESGANVLLADRGGAVERRVEDRETERLRFGPACYSADEAALIARQRQIAGVPEGAARVVPVEPPELTGVGETSGERLSVFCREPPVDPPASRQEPVAAVAQKMKRFAKPFPLSVAVSFVRSSPSVIAASTET